MGALEAATFARSEWATPTGVDDGLEVAQPTPWDSAKVAAFRISCAGDSLAVPGSFRRGLA